MNASSSEHSCDLCGEGHDSIGAALRCCAELFGDEPGPGSISVRGPEPGAGATHEEREQR